MEEVTSETTHTEHVTREGETPTAAEPGSVNPPPEGVQTPTPNSATVEAVALGTEIGAAAGEALARASQAERERDDARTRLAAAERERDEHKAAREALTAAELARQDAERAASSPATETEVVTVEPPPETEQHTPPEKPRGPLGRLFLG